MRHSAISRSGTPLKARWQSGYAADCNSVNAGSIPTSASIFSKRQLSTVRLIVQDLVGLSHSSAQSRPGRV